MVKLSTRPAEVVIVRTHRVALRPTQIDMQIQHTNRDHDQTRSTRSPWKKKKRKEEEHFLNASCLLACLPPSRSPPEEERGRSRQPGHAFCFPRVLRWSCPRRRQIRSRIDTLLEHPMTIPSWMSRILASRREKNPFSRKFFSLATLTAQEPPCDTTARNVSLSPHVSFNLLSAAALWASVN